MHTARGSRQRRRLRAGRRTDRSGAVLAVALAVSAILVGSMLISGLAGGTVAVGSYAYFSRDLPDPRQALEALVFTQQTRVYDRTGAVLLASLGSDRRVLVTFDEIPGELVDATTVIEDHTFWDNPGWDPAGFASAVIDTLNGYDRGGSTITQQLVKKRLLPESAFANGPYERKIKEIIQAIRLTEAYPGHAGKKAIMEAYLNNSFYGNRSYGVAAAARGYWNKDLKDLTLAECALLAAIPQSPTKFDLVANAVQVTDTDERGVERTRLVVPPSTAVVHRRNVILDRMKTLRVLTADRYTDADFDAAEAEPVIIAPPVTDRWHAPHFVWQVRDELGQILCGSGADTCEAIDKGGYTVITTLDYRMQRIVEKWVYAAAIIPNARNPGKLLKDRAIPRGEWGWIKALRGHNIHNAAAGVIDYRTGEVLAYAGSASYTAKGSKKLQPQFDVLSDGWRQPGSSIKPLGYVIGIDDRTMTAATMFMDVVTNFAVAGARPWYPTQADHLERGPVRLRTALQFSLNIPAIKAGFMNGLGHQLQRTRDFGLRYQRGTGAVPSESIGTLVVHPIDMISAFGTIANGGVLMPRHTILRILDADGTQVWPQAGAKAKGTRVVSRGAAYIMTDILAGNSDPRINPFWAKWRITDGVGGSKVRPAAYKTGTTSDNRDVHAYGYLAPPSKSTLPALVAGVWLGNSDNSPNDGKLSLDTSAPLWSAILSEVSKGMPIEGFARVRPKGLVTRSVDAFTGMLPGPPTRKTVTELFLPGTAPTRAAAVTVAVDIDQATGLRWQAGCAGPMVTRTFIDLSKAEPGFKRWQTADRLWQARAARGPGVSGGPKRTRTAYVYGSGFFPFGRSWGGSFVPAKTCPIGSPPPSTCVPGDPASPCPTGTPAAPATSPRPAGG